MKIANAVFAALVLAALGLNAQPAGTNELPLSSGIERHPFIHVGEWDNPDKEVVWALSSWDKPDLGPCTSIQLLDEPAHAD
jgi:hypothetical protein